MEKIHKIIAGLQVVLNSKCTNDTYAEHDVFYAGLPSEMTDEENAKMKEFGWHIDKESDGWAIFT